MNDVVQVDNPFAPTGNEMMVRPSSGGVGAVANSDQQRAIAEVQAAMVVARQYPRNQMVAAQRILNACQRQKLAEQALYNYARGGTAISGPSIRLAEAIALEWGNMNFGMREMEQGQGFSTIKAFAWDLETNVRREIDFTVPHFIIARGQKKMLTDPRDIYELIANHGQRRVRACILAVVPGDIVEAAVNQAEETMKANEDITPAGIKKMLGVFEKQFGVTKAQIEARIQRKIESIEVGQMVGLRKIFTSLNDAMSKPEDWFDPIEEQGAGDKTPKGNAAAKQALKEQAAPKKGKPEPEKTDPPAEDPPATETKQPAEPATDTKTVGEDLGDSIPALEQEKASEGEGDEPDFIGEATPARASEGQTWLDTRGTNPPVLRYAHETRNGIKWYLEPPAGDDPPAEASEPAAAEADEAEAPYLAGVRDVRAKLTAAQTVKAVEGIDRDWCNTLRLQVEEADAGLAQSVDRDITARKREIQAEGQG